MAATTTDRETDRQDGKIRAHKVTAATLVPKGVIVMTDPATGYAKNGADTATYLFRGVSYEACDNSAGASGDKSVRCEKTGEFTFNFGAANATQALEGTKVYCTDNQTVDVVATTTNDILVGVVQEVLSSSLVRVRIDGAAQ